MRVQHVLSYQLKKYRGCLYKWEIFYSYVFDIISFTYLQIPSGEKLHFSQSRIKIHTHKINQYIDWTLATL